MEANLSTMRQIQIREKEKDLEKIKHMLKQLQNRGIDNSFAQPPMPSVAGAGYRIQVQHVGALQANQRVFSAADAAGTCELGAVTGFGPSQG